VVRFLKQSMAWAALLAWLASSGICWDILQVAAWINMSKANAASMPVGAAIAKTLQDAPCPLCVASKKGRDSTEQSPASKPEMIKAKTSTDYAPDIILALELPTSTPFTFSAEAGAKPKTLNQEVPVPPPKV
jgi:hypothetical protein